MVRTEMERYSATRKKDILAHARTWRNLEDALLHEGSRSQKDKGCVIPLIRGSELVKLIKTESRIVVVGSWREGGTRS